jgi:hypothetical protein
VSLHHVLSLFHAQEGRVVYLFNPIVFEDELSKKMQHFRHLPPRWDTPIKSDIASAYDDKRRSVIAATFAAGHERLTQDELVTR